MALTKVKVKQGLGSLRVNVLDVTFDSSYTTGGLSLTPADMGLTQVYAVLVNPTGGRVFEYDFTNRKLKASASTTEVTAATDLSAVKVRLTAIGI